jgi:integrase/recombinase XerD
MSLYGPTGARKYLNAVERRRFIKAANRAEPITRLFCLVLGWSGGRISEVLALTPAAIDIDCGVANIETLKRRKRGIVRQVPLPRDTLRELNRVFKLRLMQRDHELAVQRLWTWSRTTAWRRVKEVMAAAGIFGARAMPRGLRHSFGVKAFQSNVPPHLVQRWLGHAVAHHLYLRRRDRSGRARLCSADVGESIQIGQVSRRCCLSAKSNDHALYKVGHPRRI